MAEQKFKITLVFGGVDDQAVARLGRVDDGRAQEIAGGARHREQRGGDPGGLASALLL